MGCSFKRQKYRNNFARGCTSNWSEDFEIKKNKDTVSQAYVTTDLNGK